jgi:drug/metabolite transporter (DMT)-like permease
MSSSNSSSAKSRSQAFWLGFLFAALGAVLFSAKAIVAKLTYRYGVDALTVIGFRMMFSLPFFAVVAYLQSRKALRGELPRLTRAEGLQIVFLGFLGYYLSSYLDFKGLEYISAGLERLILFLSPTLVLLLTALYLKRAISRGQWAALALSYSGVVFVFVQDLTLSGEGVLVGTAFVLGSAFTYAVYLISSGEIIARVGATRLVAYAMSVSAGFSILHFAAGKGLAGLSQPSMVYWLSLLHATIHTVLPTFMTMWAVARIGAPMTAQLGLLGPVSVLFLAGWILDEPITTLQLVGTAFTLAGAVVLARTRRA